MKKNQGLNLTLVILFEKVEGQVFHALEMVFATKDETGYNIIQGYCTGMNIPSLFEIEKSPFEYCCLECPIEWLASFFDFFDIDEARLKVNNYLEEKDCRLEVINGNIHKLTPYENKKEQIENETPKKEIPTIEITSNELMAQIYFKTKTSTRKRGNE